MDGKGGNRTVTVDGEQVQRAQDRSSSIDVYSQTQWVLSRRTEIAVFSFLLGPQVFIPVP